MSHQQTLKKLILQNNAQELKSYYIFNNLKVENVNDSTFDILIFALEHDASDDITLFLLSQYTHGDYETDNKQIPIYVALAHNRFIVAEALLHRQANINRRHSTGDYLLIYLCKAGQLNIRNLNFALHHHIDINAKDNLDKKILYYLIHGEAVDLVKMVLKFYIFDTPFILKLLQYQHQQKELSDQDLCHLLQQETQKLEISQSLYFSAIKNGNLEIIKQLYLNDGHAHAYAPIPSPQSTPSLTPIHSGVHSPISGQSSPILPGITAMTDQATISPSSSFNTTTPKASKKSKNIVDQYNMLIRATINNKLPLVRYFLSLGANINKSNNKGDTALMIAALKGELPILKLLLEHGADVHHCNSRQYTALFYACEKNHYEEVKELLAHGALINQQDKNGNTPLIMASLFGCEATVRLLLQDERCDPNLKNHHGWSAVHTATLYRHLNVLKILLEHGLSVNDSNEKGVTPLLIAAEKGYVEVVQYLVNHGAHLNEPNSNGTTPLMMAVTGGHLDTVKCLVEAGAKLDVMDIKGDTACVLAAYNNFQEMVAYLLEKGYREEELPARRNEILNAYMMATLKNNTSVVQYLSNFMTKHNIEY